jgi:hypothetical protein
MQAAFDGIASQARRDWLDAAVHGVRTGMSAWRAAQDFARRDRAATLLLAYGVGPDSAPKELAAAKARFDADARRLIATELTKLAALAATGVVLGAAWLWTR